MNTCYIRKPTDSVGRVGSADSQTGTLSVRSLMQTIITVVLLCGGAGKALTAPNLLPFYRHACLVDSGRHDGPSGETAVAFQEVVRVPGSPWMRLQISDSHLGRRSYAVLTSLLDGGQQRLAAGSLAQSGNWSAYFNGEAVRMELHVAPGDQGVFLRIEEIVVGEGVGANEAADPAFTAAASCPDPRVPSTDPRVGRITDLSATFVCTAWLASNGSLVTAGHCADMDPDQFGPMFPDRVLDFTSATIVEFNVPASTPSGRLVFAAPIDQYPVIPSSVRWEFPGYVATFVGGDWAVFACGANSTTRLRPHQAQAAFFRVTNQSPPPAFTVSVTGYGTDSTPPGSTGGENFRTVTQQTASGAYVGEFNVLPAPWPIPLPIGNYHYYPFDTEGGSSGGPVIWNQTGFVIGIHVAGGCFAGIPGGTGTSTEHDPLEFALQTFASPNTRYVDAAPYPQFIIPIKNGTIFYPHDRVREAVDGATAGANISIVAGNYNEQLTISKSVTLTAPVGGVTIGR